jgi:hypothetical protein
MCDHSRRGIRGILIRLAPILRDVVMVAIGILALLAPPSALEEFGAYGALGAVWSLMLVIGGSISFGGALTDRKVWEVAGCFTTAGAFLVWAIALTTLGPELLFWQYAGAMVSAALGQVWRGVVVASGALDLSPRYESSDKDC